MADTAYTRFLRDPDQASRRAELAAFIGPNAAKFMKSYDQQVESTNRAPGTPIKFSFFSRNYIWPAFFLGPIWFFYRKMWGWAIGITVGEIVLGFIPITRNISLPVGLALGGSAALLYLGHAVSKIEAQRAQANGGPLDAGRLAAAGGVSKTAGWVSGTAFFLVTAVTLLLLLASVPADDRTPGDSPLDNPPAQPR